MDCVHRGQPGRRHPLGGLPLLASTLTRNPLLVELQAQIDVGSIDQAA
jgi:hypothetical protein